MTQAESPLRVGLLGVGVMGADHAHRLAERTAGARLVALSDPDTARAEELAGGLAGTRVVADPLALVADDEVDAVLIASPGAVHEAQLMACLDACKPVLCEKPLTMDAESSARVLEAERSGGQPLVQVGFMRRFDPQYVALKTLLDSGELGATLLLHNIHRNKAAPNSQFRSEMIVRDSLVHEVDVARWLLDDEIATIQVITPAPSGQAPEGVLDPQVALFRMAGGAVVTSEVFVNSRVGYEVRCEAVAELGNATAGLDEGIHVRVEGRWGGEVPGDYRRRFARAYDLEVQAWVDAARRGEVVGATAWDGHVATVVCSAGMRSLREGREVAVDLT